MAASNLYMTILSPKGTIYEGPVLSATFPGAAGRFAVYPSHAPIIAALKAGVIACRTEQDRPLAISVGSGFVEVSNNRMTVCVEEDRTADGTNMSPKQHPEHER
ncbi:MAG: F0F1 ATP synthase subunit epsilon [Tannerella sp.]|jgi:F-type H+-transporting ATPase subunit epsilon|nr:F0F1 ATP synthase subunit epsilon [Tannerella sp.]